MIDGLIASGGQQAHLHLAVFSLLLGNWSRPLLTWRVRLAGKEPKKWFWGCPLHLATVTALRSSDLTVALDINGPPKVCGMQQAAQGMPAPSVLSQRVEKVYLSGTAAHVDN